ncbi:hypothetical protein [Dubosiella newyorkensis]|nr:hypothetical protein [Dubosiella newyorkensis]
MKKNTIAIIDSIKEKFSNYIYSTFTLEDVKDQGKRELKQRVAA